ncbi:MAG: metalloregulator ArsR/SmtB family transcription factor [Actinomycetota bacterium]
METIGDVFKLLQDPNRRALIDALSHGPARTGVLAERLGLSTAAVSRQLRLLRDQGVVERFDVTGDGRGRSYQLRDEALAVVQDWLDRQRWSEQLASKEPQRDAARYQARIGQFLDAFARSDTAFFERHVRDDAQFVFPSFPRALGKADVTKEVEGHPPFTAWDLLAPGHVVAAPGGVVVLTSTVTSATTMRETPSTFHVTAVFVDEPDTTWRLLHMQWTSAIDMRDIDR